MQKINKQVNTSNPKSMKKFIVVYVYSKVCTSLGFTDIQVDYKLLDETRNPPHYPDDTQCYFHRFNS